MHRIDPAHLLWTLENLADGHVVNPIRVPEPVKVHARLALDRMLALRGTGQIGRAEMAKD
jgi:quinolinate synthase